MPQRPCLTTAEVAIFATMGLLDDEQIQHLEKCKDCDRLIDLALEGEFQKVNVLAERIAAKEQKSSIGVVPFLIVFGIVLLLALMWTVPAIHSLSAN